MKIQAAIFVTFLSSACNAFSGTTISSQRFDTSLSESNRRSFLSTSSSILPLSFLVSSSSFPSIASAKSTPTTAASGLLPDLPPDAVRSYLQYRGPLQTFADYYLFDLRDQILDTNQWGEVGALFNSQNARGGQGQPSAVERNIINPMRILALSMDPDVADDMRSAQFEFEVRLLGFNFNLFHISPLLISLQSFCSQLNITSLCAQRSMAKITKVRLQDKLW